MLKFFCIFLLLGVIMTFALQDNSSRTLNILAVVIGIAGHIRPTSELYSELAKRGHNITCVTTKEAFKYANLFIKNLSTFFNDLLTIKKKIRWQLLAILH